MMLTDLVENIAEDILDLIDSKTLKLQSTGGAGVVLLAMPVGVIHM